MEMELAAGNLSRPWSSGRGQQICEGSPVTGLSREFSPDLRAPASKSLRLGWDFHTYANFSDLPTPPTYMHHIKIPRRPQDRLQVALGCKPFHNPLQLELISILWPCRSDRFFQNFPENQLGTERGRGCEERVCPRRRGGRRWHEGTPKGAKRLSPAHAHGRQRGTTQPDDSPPPSRPRAR
jgi:hypothetical protein